MTDIFEKRTLALGSVTLTTAYFTTSESINLRYGYTRQDKASRGTVLVLNGRSEFIEKYAEPIERLAHRGYDVYTLDWRGQGLSERMLPNRLKGHVSSFQHYIEDMKQFVTEKVLPTAVSPVIFLGHSMGGHICLRCVHDFPDMADILVLTSPMVDIDTRPLPRRAVRFLIRFGRDDDYAFFNGDEAPEFRRFEGNKLTSDPRRFRDHVDAVRNNPDLGLGGVTNGWIRAAYRSIDILNSPGYGAGIRKPVLMASAERDRIVSNKAQKRICAVMPGCRFLSVPGARHEILKESDAVQSVFWNAFDAFLTLHGRPA
ncbi:MAG: alpha/beta hydrolase [Desulfobacterales bacterium]